MSKVFVLAHAQARANAARFCHEAPDGYVVTFSEPKRNLPQNALFHAICTDIAKSGHEWAGAPRSAEQWKVLLVSGHAEATREGSDLVLGIEGELVNLRESTALMSKRRSSSLIEYALAFCAQEKIPVKNTA